VLSVLVNTRFQVLFHSPPGVLFTFPSRYCFAIGHQVVFRLGGWSPRFPAGFLVSRSTLDPDPQKTNFAYETFTLCRGPSHALRLSVLWFLSVLNPEGISTSGLASCAFARHYLRNLVWFLFLALLRCFSSGGSLHWAMDSPNGRRILLRRGFPIRIPADQNLFAAPRSFSQLVASFFGSWCQGIHPVLFLAWPFRIIVSSFPFFLWNCSNLSIYPFLKSLSLFLFLDSQKVLWNLLFFRIVQFSRCSSLSFYPFG